MLKKLFCITCIIIGLSLVSDFAFAQAEGGVVVTPTVIDEKAFASDILEYNVKIKNNTDRKVTIYAMVNDVSEIDGKQAFVDPSELDKETSLARWIRFRRAQIELMPGEEKEQNLEIRVNLSATPGKRHAVISLPQGNNTTIARENLLKANYPQIFISIEIVEEIIEKAQTNNLTTSRNIYLKFPVEFRFIMNNSGNRDITPRGSIYVFNRRGQEVAKLAINQDKEVIAANGGEKEFSINWDKGEGLGKFKAKLELEYGSRDKRDIQDVVYFWYLPKRILVIFCVSLFLVIVLLTTIIFRRTYKIHHPAAMRPEARNDGVLDLTKKL